jgi:hypothetical protein
MTDIARQCEKKTTYEMSEEVIDVDNIPSEAYEWVKRGDCATSAMKPTVTRIQGLSLRTSDNVKKYDVRDK